MERGSASSGPKELWILAAIFTALLSLGMAWVFTTAPGGQPDEPDHMYRAWAVWDGQLLPPQLADTNSQLIVPAELLRAENIRCFKHKPAVDASCSAEWTGGEDLVEISGRAARYNPVYYVAAGWPIKLFDPTTGLYVARVLSALGASMLAAAALYSIVLWRRSMLLRGGALIALTPTTLCIFAGFNPSSWEIAGAFAGIVGLFLLASDPYHRASRWWLVTATVGLTAMASMRVASVPWLVLIVGFACLVAGSRVRDLAARRDVRVAMTLVTAAVVWAVVWQQLAGTRDVYKPNDHSLLDGAIASFAASWRWWGQQIGYMGWVDVPPSTFNIWATITAVGVLLIGAWAMSRGKQSWLLGLAVILAICVPILMSAVVFQSVGMIWQGRYNLPVTILPLLYAALVWDTSAGVKGAIRRRITTLIGILWALSTCAMLYVNVQRYAVGLAPEFETVDYGFLFRATPWSPPGGTIAWLCVGFLSTALLSVLVLRCRLEATGGNPIPKPPGSIGLADDPADQLDPRTRSYA